jgi:hypothetical protein
MKITRKTADAIWDWSILSFLAGVGAVSITKGTMTGDPVLVVAGGVVAAVGALYCKVIEGRRNKRNETSKTSQKK